MFQKFDTIQIEYISTCVPKQVIGNTYFQSLLNEKEMKMFEKTVGILERRWASNDVTASDLGFEAAKNILEKVDKKSIKSLLFLSQTSDFKIPFTSNILQDRLGLSKNLLCLDINAGCAGFIQGLGTAFSIANSLQVGDKVLLIVAETLSKILSPNDRSTTMLFGDGAAAILVSKTSNNSTSYFNYYSDGANFDAIKIPDGGYRNQVSKTSFIDVSDDKNNILNATQLHMNGPKVFDFTLNEIAKSINDLSNKYNIDLPSIDSFLFHQSNKFIIKQISSQLAVDSNKVPINIDKFGNTSGVSIPLLLSSNFENFKETNKVMFSGYGSGLNWGNCILNISKTIISPIYNYN